jgi:hypothetical protein
MSKFYIGQQKDEPITEIVWANKDGTEEGLEQTTKTITIFRWDDESIELFKEDIPKLEAALAKARELGWFE